MPWALTAGARAKEVPIDDRIERGFTKKNPVGFFLCPRKTNGFSQDKEELSNEREGKEAGSSLLKNKLVLLKLVFCFAKI